MLGSMTKTDRARHLRLADRIRLICRNGKVNRSFGGNLGVFGVISLFGAFMLLPLIYTVVNAFKPLEEFYLFPPKFFVINPTSDNFLDLIQLAGNMWVPFTRYLFNSVSISAVATGLYIVIAGMCAYVLSKHQFYGKKTLNAVIVLSLLFTSTVMSVPQYVILSRLGCIDTSLAVIIPALGSTLGVFLLKQSMDSFPDVILESARIEGAGEMQICWRIVMPGTKPGWITATIFTFQSVWNNTAPNMIFTENRKVLPAMLLQISSGGLARAGVGAAAALFVMLPPILVFVISQSNIIETMAKSGIKE